MMAPGPRDQICDPACGTAGFLVEAGEYVRDTHPTVLSDAGQRKHFHESMFHGFDFDSTMLRIGSMNMLLHGVENPDIRYRDSLAESVSVESEKYSLILANPPFAGSLDYESTSKDLQRFIKTKKTELLFLALFLRLLKPGGRAAVIVPDGVLFGSSKAHQELRRMLVEDQKLDAVVKLPSGVFKPYAGVSTAILFFTKTNSGGTDNVWFYEVTADGWSLDDKRTPLLPEGKLGPAPTVALDEADHAKNNLPDALARWAERDGDELKRTRTEQSFCVPKDDIVEQDYDLSLNRYKEVVHEEVEHRPPLEILADLERLESEIQQGMSDLKAMLGMISRESIIGRFPSRPLGEVVEFLDHLRRPVTAADRVSGPYPYYGANGQQGTMDEYIFDEPLVLLAEDGGHFQTPERGIAYRISDKSWVNNHAHVLRPKPGLDINYLSWTLKHYDVTPFITGTTRAKLTKAGASRIPIPVPELSEQRRIAEVLDRADELRVKRREAVAHLDDLTQSIFLDMFGDPVDNDQRWPIASVGDFVARFESGKSLVAEDGDDRTAQYRVLKVSAVTSLTFRAAESKALPADYIPPAAHIVQEGDLLFSRANTAELVGATAVATNVPGNLSLPDKLWRFVWHDTPRATTLYVRQLFQQASFRREIARRATGTSGSMKNISQDKVLTIRCGMPPLNLQRLFDERITAVEMLKAAHRTHLAELDGLFGSLQERAFRGLL